MQGEYEELRKIKIVFIQKDWEDNLGVLWISALLIRNGFQTRIWVENKSTYHQLKAFSPDIVGYSCLTGHQKWVISSINKVKEMGVTAKIIVGGPHATFFPDLIENPLIDVLCRGEGELAMLEFSERLDEGNGVYDIKNLYFNVKGKIIKNELRPLISNLDSLPMPDRSYYQRYRFLASNPYKIFITSRGCPFECTFCFNHQLHELYGKPSQYVRRRSVGSVIEELSEVKGNWGLNEVRFSDDHFTLDTRWLKDFSEAYRKQIGRPYSVNSRADIIDDERLSYLKSSGCRLVCFGIETGNEELRNKVLKKDITDDQIIRAANLLKKYKIRFLTSNIIGLPRETAHNAWQTVKMNQRIGTDLPWFSMMQYYPGTQIYEEAKSIGLIDDKFDSGRLGNYFVNDYLKQENIGELQNIHSFSIVASRHKILQPLIKILTRKFKPNKLFKIIFKISYLILTFKRANCKIARIIRYPQVYLIKISGL